MYNYNFGGRGQGMSPSGLAVSQRTTRRLWRERAHHQRFSFRAYRTADEGATDYVKLLTQRFPKRPQARNKATLQAS